MASILKLKLYGPEIGDDKLPSGWIAALWESGDRPERGWLFYALKGIDDDMVKDLVDEFLDGDSDMFAYIEQWLNALHQKKLEIGDKAYGVIMWFSDGKVHTFPLGGVHVFQHTVSRKRCLTDPLYDFTHYLRWKVLSPGDSMYKVSYAIYPIHAQDAFDVMLEDGNVPWRITVDEFQDIWQSGQGDRRKRGVSPAVAARKYRHRSSVWVAFILIFLIGAWYIWYKSSLQLNTDLLPSGTSTETVVSTSTPTGTNISYVEPLSLWSITELTDIATKTYTEQKLPFSIPWDIASVKWPDGTYFVALTNDVGSAIRIAFDVSGENIEYLDKWYKTVTIPKPSIEGVSWTLPQTFVSPEISGGKLVLRSTFVDALWGSFDGLSDAFYDKLKDISIQPDSYDTTIAMLTDDKVYLYSGRVGTIFKPLRIPIDLPEGYHGERLYLSPAEDIYVLAYRNVRGKKKYTLIVMRASEDFVPDELIMKKTEELFDNLSATFIGSPYLWKEGVVAFPVSGLKDGMALINIVNWRATLIVHKGIVYPMGDNRLGVVFQSFFSLWTLEGG